MEDDALFTAQGANGRDVLDHADFVVHEHDADQDRYQALQHVGAVHTAGVHADHHLISDVEGSALSALNLSAGNGTLSAFNAATKSWTFTPNWKILGNLVGPAVETVQIAIWGVKSVKNDLRLK